LADGVDALRWNSSSLGGSRRVETAEPGGFAVRHRS